MSEFDVPLFHFSRGEFVEADYQDPLLEDYRNNPLLEALPPIWDDKTVVNKLASKPIFNASERDLPVHLRLHCVQRISRDFFRPLSRHLELQQSISRLIRDGYVGRNPLTPNYALRARKDAYELIMQGNTSGYPVNTPTSAGFALVGISGIGKSSSLLRILQMYPQVILHRKYRGQDMPAPFQIVWLKMDCPHDGSIRGLCLNFLLAVDSLVGTKYYKKNVTKNPDELLPLMAQAAAVHCLGVLVIDEIQNLQEAKDDRAAQMLNFFVQLVNTIGLPVILVGTYKALPALNGEFRNARRNSGQGDATWHHFKKDEEWTWLLQGLWKYQWTDKKVELDQEFIDVMYEESQGISDIAIKLFMLTQWRALDKELESVTPGLIRSVAKDRLTLIRPALEALRSGKKAQIQKFADIYDSVSIDDYLDRIEAEQRQAERLEVIRTELGYDVTEQTINEVSAWLIEAGVTQAIASQAAEEVTKIHLHELDEIDLHKEALKVALQKQSALVNKSSQQRSKTKPKVIPSNPNDLRLIVAQGRKKKMSAYDSLKAADYIKNPMEFLG
ncbi:ATP-binding protein [Paenibacillus beijingensis]|uniref:Tn7 transposition protein C n=1 Tax=Paenibacillus beijingensis TaxID=1126833 RepID=A0A0D5NK66_9BACL|nr:ATP-binding protein [Paenibacillus beijingensis]AJY75323.1 Tn7 transposition protein C [Paenibacillus beijingensis]